MGVMLLVLLTAHYIADFECQSDWMALNKSQRFEALWLHVLVYATVLCGIIAGYLWWAAGYWLGSQVILQLMAFWIVTFGTHLATDAVTSRMTSALWKAGRRHRFFCTVGLDQLVHAWTLFWTWQWVASW